MIEGGGGGVGFRFGVWGLGGFGGGFSTSVSPRVCGSFPKIRRAFHTTDAKATNNLP